MAGKGRKKKMARDEPAGEMSPVYKVKVPRAVLARVEEGRGRSGLNYLKFFARLLEFYADQDDVIQQYMVKQMPPSIGADVARMILANIAAAPKDVAASPEGGVTTTVRDYEEGGREVVSRNHPSPGHPPAAEPTSSPRS